VIKTVDEHVYEVKQKEVNNVFDTVCESIINREIVDKYIRHWNLFPPDVDTFEREEIFVDSVYDEFKKRLPDCVR